jgi:hypothetical protein
MLGIFLYTKFYNAFAISEKKVNGKSVNKKNQKKKPPKLGVIMNMNLNDQNK